MVMLKLGYTPKENWGWKILPKDYEEEEYNNKLVVKLHALLWEKVKNIIYIRKKGFDSVVCIDGDRRTGKSTLAKSIAYLLDSNLTINNYVAGLEESSSKIEKAKEESVLIFDEGSLVSNSRDTMKRKNVQLSKIIDVCGVKKLTLIFCMPSFFSISRDIAVHFSRFLIHVYTDEKLVRGRFAYFSKKKKRILYEIGKKNFGSYGKPKASWLGNFSDFHLPFEEEYNRLKEASLREALNPLQVGKGKPLNESDYKTMFIVKFKENCPEVTDKNIAKGFGISSSEFYRRKQRGIALHTP